MAGKPEGMQKGDLTQGPIMQTLLIFAVPTLLSNMLQSLSGTVNSIWVGRLIGEAALAATANGNIIVFLLSSAAFGFGMAATVLIGQQFGSRDIDGARRTIGTAVGFCLVLTVIIGVVGYYASPSLLQMLDTPEQAFDLANDYLKVVFLGMPFTMLSIIISMSLRGGGDARTPLIFMAVTVVLDIVLNPLLITGYGPFPELGITGSALSTLLASTVSLIAMIGYIYAKDLPLRLRGPELNYLRPQAQELQFILTKGFPMGAQMLIMSAAGIIVVGLVNREGVLTTAAYSASMQIFTYIQMPAMAISGAVSAMAAQYIGAKKWTRIDALTRSGMIVNAIMTGGLTVIVLLFDRPVMVLFLGSDSPAVPLAQHIQREVVWNFIFFGMTMVMTGTMRAAGAVWVPLGILAFTLYPVRLGFYYLTYPTLGADAIWLSFPVAGIVSLILTAIVYYRGNWRKSAIGESSAEASEHCQTIGEPVGRVNPNI
ncbi:MAG: MATE family efflux transporter [Sphingomonadaceae bacterium]